MARHTRTTIYTLMLVGTYVLSVLVTKPLLLLIPCVPLFIFFSKRERTTTEAVGMSTLSTLALWIVLFPWLKFIPISYTNLVVIVSAASIAAAVFLMSRGGKMPKWGHGDTISAASFMILIILYGRLFTTLPAPPGADMATHTYNTRVIMDKNGFPTTYEPIIPIKTFGFSPTGFGSLGAAIGLFAQTSSPTAALILTLLTYPILGLSLYILLRIYYSPIVSVLTAFLMLIAAGDIRGYITWGGNPTVLSIALLAYGLSIFLRYIHSEKMDIASMIFLCLGTVSSLNTMPTPVIAAGYAMMPFIISCLNTPASRKKMIRTFAFVVPVSIAMLIPLITSIKIPSEETMALLREYALSPAPYNVPGQWTTSLIHVPQYIMSRVGELFFIISVAGMILAIGHKHPHMRWYVTAFGMLFLLLVNTKLWFLPLSAVLYGDRIVGAATILVAIFTGLVLQFFTDAINRINGKFQWIIFIMCALLFLPYVVNYLFVQPYTMVVEAARNQTSVTSHDRLAFQWIQNNMPQHAVFQNNEGDAGIWLPMYTGRTVIRNDASPQDYDELFEAEAKLVPTHVFVGDKVVYPDRMRFDVSQLSDESKFELIFRSGNAKIYKILP